MSRPFVILILLVTTTGLILKLLFPVVTNAVDEEELKAQLDRSLLSSGYQYTLLPGLNQFIFQKESCLVEAKVSLYIDDDTALGGYVEGTHAYVFDASLSIDRPLIRPIIHSVLGRMQSIFRDGTQFSPVYAVVVGNGCDIRKWSILPPRLHMLSLRERYRGL
jgi:hypothetical protein